VAETIGDYAFFNCNRLASVSIPAAEAVTGIYSFYRVGINASVTEFRITIKANCTFNDDGDPDLQWGSGAAFKTVYDGSTIGGAKAGGTYTCNTSTGAWTYSAP
jgi:hypothetical protein